MRLRNCIFFTFAFAFTLNLAGQKKKDLYKSPVFIQSYYVEKYDDVNESNALEHWKDTGLREGRVASPVFSAKYYLKNNPDVLKQIGGKKDYKKASLHWLKYGIQEGRPSHPKFQVKEYVKHNQDLYKTFGLDFQKLLNHYLRKGIKEGRKATS
jgi:hypothetical protein